MKVRAQDESDSMAQIVFDESVVDALRESEQRFRIVTEAVSGVLWTNDADGEMHGP